MDENERSQLYEVIMSTPALLEMWGGKDKVREALATEEAFLDATISMNDFLEAIGEAPKINQPIRELRLHRSLIDKVLNKDEEYKCLTIQSLLVLAYDPNPNEGEDYEE